MQIIHQVCTTEIIDAHILHLIIIFGSAYIQVSACIYITTLMLAELYSVFYLLVIPCLTAMTNMVSCWQKNDYDDKACKQQITTFLQCVRNSVSQIVFNECV